MRQRSEVFYRIRTQGCLQGLGRWITRHHAVIGGVLLAILLPQVGQLKEIHKRPKSRRSAAWFDAKRGAVGIILASWPVRMWILVCHLG